MGGFKAFSGHRECGAHRHWTVFTSDEQKKRIGRGVGDGLTCGESRLSCLSPTPSDTKQSVWAEDRPEPSLINQAGPELPSGAEGRGAVKTHLGRTLDSPGPTPPRGQTSVMGTAHPSTTETGVALATKNSPMSRGHKMTGPAHTVPSLLLLYSLGLVKTSS